VIAFEKKAGSDDVLVLVNPRTTAVSYTVPAALLNTNWSNISTNANITLSAQVSIPAYGYLVLKKI
jgi:hypothetical protein